MMLQRTAILAPVQRTGRRCVPVRRAAGGDRPRCVPPQAGEGAAEKVLYLYTKPNCPLCEGQRDRVQGLIDRAAFMPSALSDWRLELRDITTDPAWQAAYDMEVPVLTALAADGREVRLPRPPPRMTTDRLRQHIESALPQ